jgi:hypothetical protein
MDWTVGRSLSSFREPVECGAAAPPPALFVCRLVVRPGAGVRSLGVERELPDVHRDLRRRASVERGVRDAAPGRRRTAYVRPGTRPIEPATPKPHAPPCVDGSQLTPYPDSFRRRNEATCRTLPARAGGTTPRVVRATLGRAEGTVGLPPPILSQGRVASRGRRRSSSRARRGQYPFPPALALPL